MSNRLRVALVLQILASLFSLFAWIDPLEGGAAVLMVAIITGIVWLIGRVRIPRLTWISQVSSFAIAVALIVLATSRISINPETGEATYTSMSQDLVTYMIGYRVSAVAVIAGAVFYVIKIAEARRTIA